MRHPDLTRGPLSPGDWVPTHLVNLEALERSCRRLGLDPDSELRYVLGPSCGHTHYRDSDHEVASREQRAPTARCVNCDERLELRLWVQLPEPH